MQFIANTGQVQKKPQKASKSTERFPSTKSERVPLADKKFPTHK